MIEVTKEAPKCKDSEGQMKVEDESSLDLLILSTTLAHFILPLTSLLGQHLSKPNDRSENARSVEKLMPSDHMHSASFG